MALGATERRGLEQREAAHRLGCESSVVSGEVAIVVGVHRDQRALERGECLQHVVEADGIAYICVVDGTTNRLRMVVAEECVFDRHEACHAINLFDMNQKYADVLPLDEILKYLDAWRAEKAGQVGYANDSIAYLKDLGIGEEYKGLR